MEFICHACDCVLAAPEEAAGEEVQCPSCSSGIRIPVEWRAGATIGLPATRLQAAKASGKHHRYTTGEEIARGGMGAIHLAGDKSLHRDVAMKVMIGKRKPQHVARFLAEARTTGMLHHPGVVPVYEIGELPDGSPFYTMKLLEGDTLLDIVQKLKAHDPKTLQTYPLPQLLDVFARVCDAVAYAHDRRVLHRDIKPENVMVGAFGEVQVLDWGLAKHLDRPEPPSRPDTVTQRSDVTVTIKSPSQSTAELLVSLDGAIMGTPTYMPPEQARGENSQLDERADIYSLGAMLHQLLSLSRPVSGKTARHTLRNVTKGRVEPLNKFKNLPHLPGGSVPASLIAIVQKAMAVDREGRYTKVNELRADLQTYLAGFATEAEHAGLLRRTILFAKRNKLLVAGAALITSILLGSSGLNLFLGQRAKEARATAVAAESTATSAQETAVERLAALEREQAAQALDRKASVPSIAEAARAEAALGNLDDALLLAQTAIDFEPGHAASHELLGAIHATREENGKALHHLKQATDLGHTAARELFKVVQTGASTDELRGALQQQGYPELAAVMGASLQDLLPVWRKRIADDWGEGNAKRLGILDGHLWFECNHPAHTNTKITNLEAFRGLPLRKFVLFGHPVTDLAPLRNAHDLDYLILMPFRAKSVAALKNKPIKKALFHGSASVFPPDFDEVLATWPLETLTFEYAANCPSYAFLDGKQLEYLKFNTSHGRSMETIPSSASIDHLIIHGPLYVRTRLWDSLKQIQATSADIENPEILLPNHLDPDSPIEELQPHLDEMAKVPWAKPYINSIKPPTPEQIRQAAKPFGGHLYGVTPMSMTWLQAKDFAEKMGGHLAVITSEAENQFIRDAFNAGSENTFWLGASDHEKEGTWVWVTGEPWGFEDWQTDEPNNRQGGGEHFLSIAPPYLNRKRDGWNDEAPSETFPAIIEWEDIK